MPSRLVDKEPSVPTEGIQICCVGLPRTGTVSLYRALEILGYRTYHGLEFVHNGKRDMDLLLEALLLQQQHPERGHPYTRQDFDKIWPSYAALIDLPGFAFLPSLLQAYPSAKFILTTRNEQNWLSSMRKTVFAHLASWPLYLQSLYDTQHAGPMRRLLQTWVIQFCGSNTSSDDEVLEAFRSHNATVRKLVPKDRLLVLDLDGKEEVGWKRLCEFLGKEVPKVEWPNVNNRADYAKRSERMRSQGFWRPLQFVVGVGCVAAGTLWAVRARGSFLR